MAEKDCKEGRLIMAQEEKGLIFGWKGLAKKLYKENKIYDKDQYILIAENNKWIDEYNKANKELAEVKGEVEELKAKGAEVCNALDYEKLKTQELQSQLNNVPDCLPKKKELTEHICVGKHGCRACYTLGENRTTTQVTLIFNKQRRKIKELDIKLAEAYQDIDNLDQGLHKHSRRHSEMYDHILKEKEQKIKELLNSSANRRVEIQQRVITELEQENKNLKSEVENLKRDLTSRIETYQEEETRLIDTNNKLQSKCKRLEEEHLKLVEQNKKKDAETHCKRYDEMVSLLNEGRLTRLVIKYTNGDILTVEDLVKAIKGE